MPAPAQLQCSSPTMAGSTTPSELKGGGGDEEEQRAHGRQSHPGATPSWRYGFQARFMSAGKSPSTSRIAACAPATSRLAMASARARCSRQGRRLSSSDGSRMVYKPEARGLVMQGHHHLGQGAVVAGAGDRDMEGLVHRRQGAGVVLADGRFALLQGGADGGDFAVGGMTAPPGRRIRPRSGRARQRLRALPSDPAAPPWCRPGRGAAPGLPAPDAPAPRGCRPGRRHSAWPGPVRPACSPGASAPMMMSTRSWP